MVLGDGQQEELMSKTSYGDILSFMLHYQARHGRPAPMREIAAAVGLSPKSVGSLHRRLRNLFHWGFVERLPDKQCPAYLAIRQWGSGYAGLEQEGKEAAGRGEQEAEGAGLAADPRR